MPPKINTHAISLLAILMSSIVLFISYSHVDVKMPFYDLPQLVKPPKIKDSYSFASEIIPMNPDTKERIERELLTNSYFHTSTVLALKNAPKFFPMIEKILSEEGVPDDFKYLAVAESNMSNATSPAGAKGLWQFMKATAPDYGLEVNTEVDERFHYEKSTRAACKYLKNLKTMTGSWVNAAAAFNMGVGNLSKTLAAQGEKSYFDANLTEETSRYVFRILALKEILSSPESFGFYVDEDTKYSPFTNYREVEINSSIVSLSEFAHQNGLTYRMLKYYNPWLIDTRLTYKSKPYRVKIPVQ
jgi:membrane-bound lytic murein transglycosylase D